MFISLLFLLMRKYNIEKSITKTLELCKNSDDLNFNAKNFNLKNLSWFLDQLKLRGFFNSQKRFTAKKLFELFKFYTLLVEINEYNLSQKLGYVFSGNDYLIKNSNLSRRTIQNYLDILEKFSFILRTIHTNKCKDKKYHSFRKIKILGFCKTRYRLRKHYYTYKKHFLSNKDRFYFFNSLYGKYARKYQVLGQETNPFFYDNFHPFRSDGDPRYNIYPLFKTGRNPDHLMFYSSTHTQDQFGSKALKPKLKIVRLRNKTEYLAVV